MTRLLSLISGAALATTVASTAFADPPHPKRIAVIVGANEPAPGRQPLRYAHSDAQRMADVLVRVGKFDKADVQTLLDPKPADLLAAVDRAAAAAKAASGDSLFVFYYSGHSDGQSVYPHGEALGLAALRERLAKSGARIRIGILDTCRGGSWTRAKGFTVGPALDPVDVLNVSTEGTALLSSSSGLENAHEADAVKGSFFTHHITAGLLAAQPTRAVTGTSRSKKHSTTRRRGRCATARGSPRPRSIRASISRCAGDRTSCSRRSARRAARSRSRNNAPSRSSTSRAASRSSRRRPASNRFGSPFRPGAISFAWSSTERSSRARSTSPWAVPSRSPIRSSRSREPRSSR